MLRKPFLSIAVACALTFTPVGAFAGHGHGHGHGHKSGHGHGMGMGIIIKVAITVMAIRATVMGTLITTIITTITTIIATDMAMAGGGTAAGGGMELAPAGAGRPMVTFGFATRRTCHQEIVQWRSAMKAMKAAAIAATMAPPAIMRAAVARRFDALASSTASRTAMSASRDSSSCAEAAASIRRNFIWSR